MYDWLLLGFAEFVDGFVLLVGWRCSAALSLRFNGTTLNSIGVEVGAPISPIPQPSMSYKYVYSLLPIYFRRGEANGTCGCTPMGSLLPPGAQISFRLPFL